MNTVANESYPLNLLDEIAEGDWEYPLPEDFNQSLSYVLAGMTEREQFVIHAYFYEGKTYAEIGKSAGVTRERIRQLIEKSLRKLRHPTRVNFLIYGVKGVIQQTSVEAAQNAVSKRLERALSQIGDISHFLHTITGKEEYADISEKCAGFNDSIPLEELNLSCRSFNCLKHAGVTQAGDIARMSKGELMRVKNLGKKSVEEVIDTIHKLGLNLADERLSKEGI